MSKANKQSNREIDTQKIIKKKRKKKKKGLK